MQTNITEAFLKTSQGKEAESILRSCVHCGFCTATCPTYQLLGDELDSPRGRIYLIKQVLEGNEATTKTRSHLDRCLTCRACETTCPSGVRYGRLVDIGREIVEQDVPRTAIENTSRYLLRQLIPYPKRFAPLLKIGQIFRPVFPQAMQTKIPKIQKSGDWPAQTQQRKMLVLEGCAQQVVTAQTNVSTAVVLNKLGIQLITADKAVCCGAVSHHLSATKEAKDFIRQNIDAWWPFITDGIEAIVVTASGCGVMLKDYAHIMQDDIDYADKANRITELAKDISEILQGEDFSGLNTTPQKNSVSFHSPCTLQHGLKLSGVVENILQQVGYDLKHVDDSHLCCGSAGTYSVLQPKLSKQLLANKITALQNNQPDIIATANIGCQMHLDTKASVPVKHWIELVEKALS